MKKIATIIAIVFFTSIGFAQNGAKIEFKQRTTPSTTEP
jgi:hypothetical protein